MAYRNKEELILKLNPDIVIIPECENLGENNSQRLWFGDNKNKGIGIYAYSNYRLELFEDYNSKFKYVIPIKVVGETNFYLLAIWAMNDLKNPSLRYIGQVYSAIKYYEKLLDKPIIIIGDFNWNVIWDKESPALVGSLTDLINILKSKNIVSAYHTYNKEIFGKEKTPTLFMYHKLENSHHIDYCFISSNFKIKNVEIGDPTEWIKQSDHMPIIIDLE